MLLLLFLLMLLELLLLLLLLKLLLLLLLQRVPSCELRLQQVRLAVDPRGSRLERARSGANIYHRYRASACGRTQASHQSVT